MCVCVCVPFCVFESCELTLVCELLSTAPWTWFCGGDLAPSACFCIRDWLIADVSLKSTQIRPTTCLRQAIVCFTQILLIVAFYVFLVSFRSTLPGALSGSELLQVFEIGSILFNVTAVLSGLIGVSFLSCGVWVILVTGDTQSPHTWVSLLVQGVAWITIAFSLRIRLQNPTKQVAYIWWILTFLLVTLTTFLAALDLLIQAAPVSVEVFLIIASWPVSWLLLTCAIHGERWIMIEVDEDLTEAFSDGGEA